MTLECDLEKISPDTYMCKRECCRRISKFLDIYNLPIEKLHVDCWCEKEKSKNSIIKEEKIDGPGITKLVENFTKAVINHAKDGMRKVTEEQYKDRLTVCSQCDFQDNDRCKHMSCGCVLSKKARWRSENCPMGKWPEIPKEE